MMNTCQHCGSRVVEGAFACGTCGAHVQTARKQVRGGRLALVIISTFTSLTLMAGLVTFSSLFAFAVLAHSHNDQAGGGSAGSSARAGTSLSCSESTPSMIPAPSGKPQFVYFYDESCTSCQKMRPVIDEFEKKYQGKIDFVQIDVATSEGQCEHELQGFEYIPSMLFIDAEGFEQDFSDGSMSRSNLKQELDWLLGAPALDPGINV